MFWNIVGSFSELSLLIFGIVLELVRYCFGFVQDSFSNLSVLFRKLLANFPDYICNAFLDCSKLFRKLFGTFLMTGSELFRIFLETRLTHVWKYFHVLLPLYFFVWCIINCFEHVRNVFGRVSELFWTCFVIVQELFRDWSELVWNCFGTCSELFRNVLGTGSGIVRKCSLYVGNLLEVVRSFFGTFPWLSQDVFNSFSLPFRYLICLYVSNSFS